MSETEEFRITMEKSMSEIKHRQYTGNSWNEYVLLCKKYFIMMPLFLLTYVAYNINILNSKIIEFNSAHLLVCGTVVCILDTIVQWPLITIIICSVVSYTLDNNEISYIHHEYLLYGIMWNIGIKLCDNEDATLLFPALALLNTPAQYITEYLGNHKDYFHIFCTCVIAIYTLLFHQKWKNETISNIGTLIETQNTYVEVLCIFTLYIIGFWGMFVCTLHHYNVMKDDYFDFYNYLDLDFLKYKGICTFVLILVTNLQLFRKLNWKYICGSYIALFFILNILQNFIDFKSTINIVDTIGIGITHFIFEPCRALLFTNVDRKFWQLAVFLNVFVKQCVFVLHKVTSQSIHMMYLYAILHIGSIIKILCMYEGLDF